MWESKTCISGSIYDLSTSYYLTFKNRVRYQEDSEIRMRFYLEHKQTELKRPHMFTLVGWKKSMRLRYTIESLIFFLILIVFQLEISSFNSNLYILIAGRKTFKKMDIEISDRGGKYYAYREHLKDSGLESAREIDF